MLPSGYIGNWDNVRSAHPLCACRHAGGWCAHDAVAAPASRRADSRCTARLAQDRFPDHFDGREMCSARFRIPPDGAGARCGALSAQAVHAPRAARRRQRWPGRAPVPRAALPRPRAWVSAAPARRAWSNRSFTAITAPADRCEARIDSRDRAPDCRWLDSISRRAVRIALRWQGFSRASSSPFPARRLSASPRRGVLQVLPRNAVACTRMANLSSISVLARRLKLTGP